MELKGKHIAVGVSGGIAAYKAAETVSLLGKQGAEVRVIMTEAAREFVSELTFRSLSKYPVATEMFSQPQRWEIEHVALAKWADALVIAPATANTLAKIACGIADNMLTCVALATKAKCLAAPAMNTGMYLNPMTQENLKKLSGQGWRLIEPGEGMLACGDVGKGRMAEPSQIVEAIIDEIGFEKDLQGLNVLVTAGPTREALDPVRYLTNHSSGKMGYAIARAARQRGARVTLVTGPTALADIDGVNMVKVVSAEDMLNAVMSRAGGCDIIVKAAAVGDFAPVTAAGQKLKKAEALTSIELRQNPDILDRLGKQKTSGQVLVGFCMETQQLMEHARTKLGKKNCDLMVANNLFDPGAGFGVDTNTVTILDIDGSVQQMDNMPKQELAHVILNRAMHKYRAKQ